MESTLWTMQGRVRGREGGREGRWRKGAKRWGACNSVVCITQPKPSSTSKGFLQSRSSSSTIRLLHSILLLGHLCGSTHVLPLMLLCISHNFFCYLPPTLPSHEWVCPTSGRKLARSSSHSRLVAGGMPAAIPSNALMPVIHWLLLPLLLD